MVGITTNKGTRTALLKLFDPSVVVINRVKQMMPEGIPVRATLPEKYTANDGIAITISSDGVHHVTGYGSSDLMKIRGYGCHSLVQARNILSEIEARLQGHRNPIIGCKLKLVTPINVLPDSKMQGFTGWMTFLVESHRTKI